MATPRGGVRLARIVTCYRQWSFVRHWIGDDELFTAGVEWLVVNDCPTDPCPADLAAELDRRKVHVWHEAQNLGRAAARNFGARHATADWIEHIDGDDLPLPLDPASLTEASEADVLQFPTRVVTMPVTEIVDRRPFLAPLEHSENWSPLLPALVPFDVRLTATMWNQEFFHRIGGYDGRFEGIEDVHLAFKASQLQARVVRCSHPKQVYCRRPQRETFERTRIEGAARFFRWLRLNHPDVAPEIVHGWRAKEDLYLSARAGADFVRGGGWFSYLKWRYFS